MNVYTTDKIRNVVLLGHGGCGKTSLNIHIRYEDKPGQFIFLAKLPCLLCTDFYSKPNLQICRDALLEAVAETSEEFMERYFNGDSFLIFTDRQMERRHFLAICVCHIFYNLSKRSIINIHIRYEDKPGGGD